MNFGHFDAPAREYVITRPDTPRAWSNYLGSTEYGAIITNHAGGYSFYKSGATGRFLRMRFNGIPLDQPGRQFYLRDRQSKDYWSAAWQPVAKPLDQFKSTCRHGTAYTVIESEYSGIATESTYFVPLGQTFEYWRLKVTNKSSQRRELSVFTYCEFANLWHTFQDLVNLQYSLFITRAFLEDGVLGVVCNPNFDFNGDLTGCNRSWMALTGTPLAGYETVRERFLGSYGGYANPDVVVKGECSNYLAQGDNVCGGLQGDITLEPGETKELIVLLGIGTIGSHGKRTVAEFGNPARCEAELQKLKASWHKHFNNLQVKTPDGDFDHMVNVWNAYNALMTYEWSRSCSLVYTGDNRDGFGYRDTVQDMLGVCGMLSTNVKERLTLMISAQDSTGGAQPEVRPWSHKPGSMKPTPAEHYRSDDCQWFFNTIPAYVAETGDVAYYDQVVPYADKGEATVFGHMRRAIEFNLERTGRNGLPCGLLADWNDCLKLGYKGESVFVTFQVRLGLKTYAEIAAQLGRPSEQAWALAELKTLDEKIARTCWDGNWFIWAITEDGVVYGTKNYPEGQVYLNTQVWAVMSGHASKEQTDKALDTVKNRLASDWGVAMCNPPFDKTPVKVQRAVLFNPGNKENGGIFSHTQSWAVLAEIARGNGDLAYQYYRSFMPAAQNDKAEIREIEPYVHCQSTHAPASKKYGRSRVPWLSGTASWSYYTAAQHILGIRPEFEGLRIDPCIPKAWPGFSATRVYRGKTLKIEVRNPAGLNRGVRSLEVDGKSIQGNLLRPEQLRDGSTIIATLS